MVIKVIKINVIQKKLLNHLKNYIINLLILTNLMKSIINLRIILQNLKKNKYKNESKFSINQRRMER